MDKRLKSLITICLLLFSLTGCKNMKEVDRITFPVVLGIDRDELTNNIKIYAQVSTVSTQSSGQQSQSATMYDVLESEGRTLKEAMDDLIDHAQQYISWKQLMAVVFTEKTARHGISKELDILARDEQVHLNSYLILTTENLKDLLGMSPVLETGLPTTIVGVGLVSEQSTHSKAITMRDFFVENSSKEIESVLPLLQIYRTEMHQGQKKFELNYAGCGVFCNDKLVGRINEDETEAMLFISGIKDQGSFEIVNFPDTQDREITVSRLTTTTKYTPFLQSDKPSMTLKMRVEYDIYSFLSKTEISIQEVEKVNNMVAEVVKQRVENVIHKAQAEFKSDIFGFGGKIYRKYPQFWQKNKDHWPELFSAMEVKVDVEAKLKDTGELTNSFEYRKNKE